MCGCCHYHQADQSMASGALGLNTEEVIIVNDQHVQFLFVTVLFPYAVLNQFHWAPRNTAWSEILAGTYLGGLLKLIWQLGKPYAVKWYYSKQFGTWKYWRIALRTTNPPKLNSPSTFPSPNKVCYQ